MICSVRVSNELGRGSSKAAKSAIVVTVMTSLTIGFVLFLVFLFLRERLAYIFTPNPEVAAAVGDLSPLLAFSMLLNSVQPVLSGNLFLLSISVEQYEEIGLNMHLFFIFVSKGVAIGAGWQSIVAYVNIGCYYLIGIPTGILLGKLIHLEVKVSYHLHALAFSPISLYHKLSFCFQIIF